MRWENGRRSNNVEDRRNVRISSKAKGGGIIVILLALVGMYFGIDPAIILHQGSRLTTRQQQQTNIPTSPEEDKLADFVSVVLADIEDTWSQLFSASNLEYNAPRLVLFKGSVESACGFAQAAMGPFYCSADQKVYIDLSFYQELRDKLGAPGDFAQAYVIAHEIGHHVQNLLGISDMVNQARARLSETEYNHLSVKLELQADCFAGLWAHHAEKARQILEQGDLEEALNAASMIGDDRLQVQSRGYVTPDSFTHGTSEQRISWFSTGFKTGSFSQCDTFSAASL